MRRGSSSGSLRPEGCGRCSGCPVCLLPPAAAVVLAPACVLPLLLVLVEDMAATAELMVEHSWSRLEKALATLLPSPVVYLLIGSSVVVGGLASSLLASATTRVSPTGRHLSSSLSLGAVSDWYKNVCWSGCTSQPVTGTSGASSGAPAPVQASVDAGRRQDNIHYQASTAGSTAPTCYLCIRTYACQAVAVT
jgi:hypothetical protein